MISRTQLPRVCNGMLRLPPHVTKQRMNRRSGKPYSATFEWWAETCIYALTMRANASYHFYYSQYRPFLKQ